MPGNAPGIRVFGEWAKHPKSGFDIYGLRKVEKQPFRCQKARNHGLFRL
jgi:hypothetical protein